MTEAMIVVLVLVILVVIIIAKTAVVVPQQSAYVVERLGKYANTLDAGFHILVPFIDTIRYRHSLKETAVDIPEQICITRDNVQVHVDGVLSQGSQSRASLLWGGRLSLCHYPAGADHAA